VPLVFLSQSFLHLSNKLTQFHNFLCLQIKECTKDGKDDEKHVIGCLKEKLFAGKLKNDPECQADVSVALLTLSPHNLWRERGGVRAPLILIMLIENVTVSTFRCFPF